MTGTRFDNKSSILLSKADYKTQTKSQKDPSTHLWEGWEPAALAFAIFGIGSI